MSTKKTVCSLESLIRQNVIDDGEVLRYKTKTGKLLLVGRAGTHGIELEGHDQPLKYQAWEHQAGRNDSRVHKHAAGSLRRRATEFTFTCEGESLQDLHHRQEGEGYKPQEQAPANDASLNQQSDLLDDENDEFCYVCGLGGDLICCETCPAVYHTACMGLTRLPTEDWFCPACRCCVCGHGGFDPLESPLLGNPIPIPVSEMTAPTGPQLHLAHGSAAQQGGRFEKTTSPPPPPSPPVITNCLADTADGRSAVLHMLTNPPSAAEGYQAYMMTGNIGGDINISINNDDASRRREVQCSGSSVRAHLGCLPREAQVTATATPLSYWFVSIKLAAQSRILAELCGKGAAQFTTLQDGTPLSFQIIRGAAVFIADAQGQSSMSGPVPAYSDTQRAELRRILSASLHVLHSGYSPIIDGRTGGDLLPWMVRGARFASGAADFSSMHTAVLFAGKTVIGAACFRLLGSDASEIPVLAIRPELRGCGLGSLFLSRIEVLLAAGTGVRWVLTPAFAPWRAPYMPALLPAGAPLPPPLQQRWGYSLVSPRDMLALGHHRLIRMPGVLITFKPLSEVRMPRELPATLSLAKNIDIHTLHHKAFLKPAVAVVSAPEGMAAAAAAPLPCEANAPAHTEEGMEAEMEIVAKEEEEQGPSLMGALAQTLNREEMKSDEAKNEDRVPPAGSLTDRLVEQFRGQTS